MAASSGSIPDVTASQVLSVSPSLPTNKLLDNLTVKSFDNRVHLYLSCICRKTNDFYNYYHKIMRNDICLQVFLKPYWMTFFILMNVLMFNYMLLFV